MSLPKRAAVPFAHEAFFDGKPVPRIHAGFAAEIRAAMSPAEYLLGLIEQDPVAWHEGQLAFPADGSLAALELRARNKDDRADPITPDHWDAAALQINSEVEQLEGAQKALRPIAEHIANLALSTRLRTYARPFGGGAMIEIEPSLWEVDEPLARAATCSLNIEDPFGRDTPPTHFIFVDPTDLKQTLSSLTVDDKIYLVKELKGGDRKIPYPDAVKEVTEWICARAVEPHYWYYKDWRRQHWEEAVEALGSWATGSVFQQAWTAAVSKHPHLRKPGRPSKDEVPSPRPDQSNVDEFPSKNPK
jgi:hypothetical protein